LLLVFSLHPEVEGSKALRKSGILLQHYKVLQPKDFNLNHCHENLIQKFTTHLKFLVSASSLTGWQTENCFVTGQ
jgi:hypothetical protein